MGNAILPSLIEKTQTIVPVDQWSSFRTLVAVSGGPDSVALLRILQAIFMRNRFALDRLVVAHVNHGVRGVASDADQQFVETVADQMGLECRVASLCTSDVQPSEESLRDARYAALVSMARDTDSRMIALGHNLDDQIETILFRIFRGTGLGGLAGMSSIRVVDETISLVRPLLSISRAEIGSLLDELNQEFRHDESNTESRFTRNFLRHEILPKLKQRFGESLDSGILRLGQQAKETEGWLNEQTHDLWSSVTIACSDEVLIETKSLREVPTILVRQLFKQIWQRQNWPLGEMTFGWWDQLAEAVQATSNRLVLNLPGGIRLESSAHGLRLKSPC